MLPSTSPGLPSSQPRCHGEAEGAVGLLVGLGAALLLLGVLKHPNLRLKWCWEACSGGRFGFSSPSLCFGQWWLLHHGLPPASAQRLLAPLRSGV